MKVFWSAILILIIAMFIFGYQGNYETTGMYISDPDCVYRDVKIIAPERINVTVGSAAVFNVGIENIGNCTMANIVVGVRNLPGWESVSGIIDIIFPEQVKYILITVTPPRTISSGIYNMTVTSDINSASVQYHKRTYMLIDVSGTLWVNHTDVDNETVNETVLIGEEEKVASNDASEVQDLIRSVNEDIQAASGEGKDILVANELLLQAVDEWEKQNYDNARSLAMQANDLIIEAQIAEETEGTLMDYLENTDITTIALVIGGLVVALIIFNKVMGRKENEEIDDLRDEIAGDEEESDEEDEDKK